MFGITKASKQFEDAWTYAKHLYLDPELARKLYETNNIISPVKKMWSLPFYSKPDPFFSGQQIGQLYIAQAPNVPIRTSSPYYLLAKQRLQDVGVGLRHYAEANDAFDAEKLMPESRRLVRQANETIRRQIEKNVFLAADAPANQPVNLPVNQPADHKEQP